MSDNPALDTLLKTRNTLSKEVEEIRDVLAGRQKVLDSLNTTIDLLRGWTNQEAATAVRAKRNPPKTYDDAKIASAIEDLFISSEDGREFHIQEIVDHLANLDLVPTADGHSVRAKVSTLIKNKLPDIRVFGAAQYSRWKLVTKQEIKR